MNKFDFEKTVGGRLLAELRRDMLESIVVPNSLLPEEFHDKVRGGRTLARLQELCDVRDRIHTEHQKAKAAKARNIEKLARQVEAMSRYNERGDFIDIEHGFDYSECEIDEIALYKNECALVGGMVNSGMIDADDLLED
jgi:hypothetical protein